MRLLFLAPYIPSPIRVRTYQLLRHLVAAGCEITLATLEDPFATPAVRAELTALCRAVYTFPLPKRTAALRCLAALPTPTPLWVAYCRSGELAAKVQALATSGEFDVAHVEHLRAAYLGASLGTLPRVFDAVDCITALQKQMLAQPGSLPSRAFAAEEWLKLRRYEPRAYAAFPSVAVTSQFDADALTQLGVAPAPTVIPNGVDLDYFQLQPLIAPDPNTIIFSGKMSYRANDDAARYFIEEILPRIRASRPATKLIIAGSEPSSTLQSIAQNSDNVRVTGFVDDLRPSLAQAALAVCPLRIGVGIQNKALEAMAMGRPVVATSIAGRALPQAQTAGALQLADDPESFARACVALLAEPERAEAAGREARRYVEAHHRWDRVAERFLELYRREMTRDWNNRCTRPSQP